MISKFIMENPTETTITTLWL